ncbi:hypothetical protein CMEL01_13994, partial [Colletotrichum melonis]
GWDGVGDEDDVAIRLELRSGVLSLSDLAYLIRAPPPRVPATCTVRTSLAAAAALLLAVCGTALCRTGHQSGDLPLEPKSNGGDDWLHLIIAASGKYLAIWNIHCSPLNVTNVTLLTLTYPFPCHLGTKSTSQWFILPPRLNVLEQLEKGLSRLDPAEATD